MFLALVFRLTSACAICEIAAAKIDVSSLFLLTCSVVILSFVVFPYTKHRLLRAEQQPHLSFRSLLLVGSAQMLLPFRLPLYDYDELDRHVLSFNYTQSDTRIV